MSPIDLIIPLFVVGCVAIRIHWRLRDRLKTFDGWKQRWEQTVKWVTFGGATTFDHRVLWAVMSGQLSRSTDADIRRDARILRVLFVLFVVGVLTLLSGT